MKTQPVRSIAVWSAFALLCLLSASLWLLPGAGVTEPGIWRQVFLFGFAGAACGALSWRKRQSLLKWWRVAVAGVVLLDVPFFLSEGSFPSGISDVNASFAFAFVPIVVVLSETRLASGSDNWGIQRDLGWCVLGLAGLLLVLPVTSPDTLLDWVRLIPTVLSVLAVGLASVWLHRLLQETKLMASATVLLSTQAFVLLFIAGASWAYHFPGGGSLPPRRFGTLAYPLQFLLLMWLIRELEPRRLSSRFLLVPLLTTVQGMFLFRPELTLRFCLGLGFLLVGAGGLMADRSQSAMVSLKLS